MLQGAGSAAVRAAGLGLIAHTHPAGPHRVRAIGIWGATLGGAIALGPVYAALITQLLGWRSLYWGLALLSAAAVALTTAVPESRAEDPRRLDVWGALTLAAGTAALVAGFGEGRGGWLRPLVLALLAAGVLLLALFAVVERRVAAPMLDPALWRGPDFLAAGVGALVTGLSVIGLMSYLPTVLQIALGMSPLSASLLLVVWSGLSVVSALQARRLAPYAAATTQVALGLLLSSVGQALLHGLQAGGSPARLVPGLAVAGVGSGILNAALARLAVSSVPADRSAMGSGANNTARYVGSALGLALTVAVITAPTNTTHPPSSHRHRRQPRRPPQRHPQPHGRRRGPPARAPHPPRGAARRLSRAEVRRGRVAAAPGSPAPSSATTTPGRSAPSEHLRVARATRGASEPAGAGACQPPPPPGRGMRAARGTAPWTGKRCAPSPSGDLGPDLHVHDSRTHGLTRPGAYRACRPDAVGWSSISGPPHTALHGGPPHRRGHRSAPRSSGGAARRDCLRRPRPARVTRSGRRP